MAERGLDPGAMAGRWGFSGGMTPPVVGGTARLPGDNLERGKKNQKSRQMWRFL